MATATIPVTCCIAKEDLKDKYNDGKGEERIRVYLQSLEQSRKVKINIDTKENEIIAFSIDRNYSREDIKGTQEDIQGEVIKPGAIKKYEPWIPSKDVKDKKVSRETHKVMELENQKRLQSRLQSYSSPLTVDALEKHDLKHTSGPCRLRQFACGECHHSWWRNVLKSKPVSRCTGRRCGNKRYDALPREKEFGIGRFACPNTECNRFFFGYCEATDEFKCRRCGELAKPYIHPKWKKRSRLNPDAKPFQPHRHRRYQPTTDPDDLGPKFVTMSMAYNTQPIQGYQPTRDPDDLGPKFETMSMTYSMYDKQPIQEADQYLSQDTQSSLTQESLPDSILSDLSHQPAPKQPEITARKKPKPFNPSSVHEPTGGTVSTFLTQIDFEKEGEYVDLDYDSDDDDEKVGPCRFECFYCGHKFTVIVRMQDTAKCFFCGEENRPMGPSPPDALLSRYTGRKHQCSRCNGKGNCSNLIAASRN